MLDTTGETIYFHWKINITRLLFCLFNTKQHFKMNYFWRTVRRVGGGGPVWALQWSECVCECVCVSSLQYLYWSMYQSEELHCSYCFMFLFCSAQVEVGGGGGGRRWVEVGGGGGWRGLLLSVSPVWVNAHTVYWQCTCIKLFIPADDRLCVLFFGKQEAKQKRRDVWDELVCVCVFVSPVSPSGNPTPAWDDYRVYRSRQK